MTPQWITFSPRGDERGVLVAIESDHDIPFTLKRVYTLTGLPPGGVRGGHAHKRLRQVIVCLAGSCVIDLDDGEQTFSVPLDDPVSGLMLEPMIWHEMREFSGGCVLMVLASDHYDEADYIRDRADFMKCAKTASA